MKKLVLHRISLNLPVKSDVINLCLECYMQNLGGADVLVLAQGRGTREIVKHRAVLSYSGTDRDAHTQTHRETVTHKHTHHELSRTHQTLFERLIISYAQEVGQIWGDFTSAKDATASLHASSVSAGHLVYFSVHSL